jgi:heme-degrading monooxygenase HmoA
MFSVVFEVHPRPDRWDAYLGHAKALRPELEKIDGFLDNTRYRSLTREGWLLSLSSWRDEKAVVRWRTQAGHHQIQEKGRSEVFLDYHLRVGQVTEDTRLPPGQRLVEQRLDETQVGTSTSAMLIDARHPADRVKNAAADEVALWLGLVPSAEGLVAWDVFDAVLTPGEVILLLSWRDAAAAEAFRRGLPIPEGARVRRVRVVRDYGMFDRREAPQFFPDAAGAPTIHA